jgi:hypothetical protein
MVHIAIWRIFPLIGIYRRAQTAMKFGYSSFRKRYYQKSELPHRIIIENFIRSVNTGSEQLVPIRSVIPTISLLEEIQRQAIAFIKSEKG